MTAYKVYDAARRLTTVVGPTNVLVDTNRTVAREYEVSVWGYETAEAAWGAVVASVTNYGREHTNAMYGNAGWVKGTREAYGEWGGYLWWLENEVAFETSATNIRVSPYGVTNYIARVLVGTIGDYEPMTNVVDRGPRDVEGLTNYAGAGVAEDALTPADYRAFYVVLRVESIEASCPKADNSPQTFEGHKTDFGNPCAATSPGQALIIFYNAVLDGSFQVEDFDVTLKANVLPTSITADQLSESWAKVEGPASGSLNRTDTFEVKYQNPKVGGLYKFEFDLGLSGCAKSGANVDLPLAGADMTSWLDTETKAVGTWATAHKTATEDANDSPIPGVTLVKVYLTWCSISGSFFDYEFDPVDAQQHAPCRRFQPTIGPNGQYGYVTVNGVVVHGSKINNMMWALFGRYWGWSETSLRLGAHLNQLGRDLRLDGATSQNAIGFGDDIHDNPSANITAILTPANLRTLQDPNALIEEKLWPSPDAADTGNSTFTRPTLPTTP